MQKSIKVLNTEEITDCASVVDIYGQGCNHPTKKGVDGFQVDFDVEAVKNGEKRFFHIVYQSCERSCNITAYSGYEMTTALKFGCDADESLELIEWFNHDDDALDELCGIAEELCKNWLELNDDSE